MRKLLPTCILLLAGILTLAAPAARAQEDQPLTPKQQEAVKKLIHDTLVENPAIIGEAIEALRQKEQLATEMAVKKALVERKEEIFNDPNTPVLGNPKGDVTIVEFFDYRCPYCKAITDSLLDLVRSDGKIRLVMKELPILGDDSQMAAHAALASRNQKKYEDFFVALMHLKGPVNETTVMKTAAEVGINVEKLKKDMHDPAIESLIENDVKLAHILNLNGTPGFIFGEQIIDGAISPQQMQQLVNQIRKKS